MNLSANLYSQRHSNRVFGIKKRVKISAPPNETSPVEPKSAVNHQILTQVWQGGKFCLEGAGYSISLRTDSDEVYKHGPYIVIEENLHEQAYWSPSEGWTDPCITHSVYMGPGHPSYSPGETNHFIPVNQGKIYTNLVLKHLAEIQANQRMRKKAKRVLNE